MRKLEELIDLKEPAIELLRQWAREAAVPCEILPPGDRREEVLLDLQVTTHSTLGALAYDTGGVLIDDGWLRLLGSGHPRLQRSLSAWNAQRADGCFLVGDDVVGGFFAINGGALGPEVGSAYYWAPDNLDWECLNVGFTDLVHAFILGRVTEFYESLRWPNWRADIMNVSSDQCFSYYPFLWTKEGSLEKSSRSIVPVSDAFDLKVDIVRQLCTGS
jgi:hypothetical protein